ncbi:receptor-type tyrosine-protein phosphatase H-like isoform X3 [Chaetodon auriga]|uniref:receptor-type tyrosine-protein phosphatase H-like isoform X3 n=1 Tax=Chaetodon auriga TaxID=39042 RepID=UPI0040328BA2
MKPLSFRITSAHLLLCVFLLRDITDSSTPSAPGTTLTGPSSTEAKTTTPLLTTPLTTLSVTKSTPPDAKEFRPIGQNETSITLQWAKVDGFLNYMLLYGEEKIDVSASAEHEQVTHTISGLTSGTTYDFILFAVFDNVNSSGVKLTAATAPENVKDAEVSTQTETSITLLWHKVNNISTYILQYDNKGSLKEESISDPHQGPSVTHEVSSLTAGTKYHFTLITVFADVNSTGYTFDAVTAPLNAKEFRPIGQNETSITLQWAKVDGFPNYMLLYGEEKIDVSASAEHEQVTHTISGLRSGTKYDFILFTVFENVNSSGVNLTAATAPENVKDVGVSTQTETSITLMWHKVNNISTYILQYDNKGSLKEESISDPHQGPSVTHEVSSLTAGTKYHFTLITVFADVNSTGYTFDAATAPLNAKEFRPIGQNETSITLQWAKVDGFLNYMLLYGEEKIDVSASAEHEQVTHTISGLTSGTTYDFILFTVFENVNSSGVNLTAATAPLNAKEFRPIGQNETSITLQWAKVDGLLNYMLLYGEEKIDVSASAEHEQVTHTISGLTSGTKYDFILFTVFENVNSSGVNLTAATAPLNAKEFRPIEQNETSVTLQWAKVDGFPNYMLLYGEEKIDVSASAEHEQVTHTISGLTSGTTYDFILFTVFENVNSSGVNLTAATAPENVKDVEVSTQTETSITLTWHKVNSISTYILQYDNKGSLKEESISDPHQGPSVTHEVSSLTAGTKYHFTLITVFADINSTKYTFDAATVPSMVALVRVTERAVTSITLEWSVDVNKDWSYFLQMNGENLHLHPHRSRNVVSHSFTSLQPGTEFPYSVITMFSGLNSTAYKNFTLTAINCNTVAWHVTNSSIQGTIEGLFTSATATNESREHISPGSPNVSFTGLYPGATYNVSLLYERSSTWFQQCRHELTIIPPNIRGHCEYVAFGYSVLIVLDESDGVWRRVEVNMTGETSTIDKGQSIEIKGLQPAKTYEVSLASLSKTERRSEPFVFSCSTDPRGVIAGSVCAVLLIGALVCLAVFILLKRPNIISRKKSFIGGSKLSYKKCKAISAAKFADHFYELSEDENRGFSLEYESLIPVGTEQTQKEALLPENKARNRFTNVLPYDWCRVKLSSTPNGKSDYINASYMPGHNSNREYIATQGPLPSTVNDFWRMVWEQRVRGIVMVTNCIEGGRTKCEQYWPADSEPRLLGELLVTMRSEQQEPNWTLREFRLEHSKTSEERTVKHFHFTAWPDHGVPQSTEVLIQFRGLVRQHIERDGAGAPTVVHCSAGVGRTGTIIALDVLLQQLVKEREVGINAFVHKMRLSRPHMVQTESQYIFLHQCIIDCLKPNEKTEENIYENADMIYANATALREFHKNA